MIRTMCVRYYADGVPADSSMCSPRTRDAFVPRFPHLWDALAEQAGTPPACVSPGDLTFGVIPAEAKETKR